MMDPQENTLGQEMTEEMQNAAQAANSNQGDENTALVSETEEISPVESDSSEQRKVYKSKKEVIERMKEIAHNDDSPKKDEIDYLKTAFYKLHFAEREAEMKAYIEAGGDPESYKVLPDADEEEFKAEMSIIKEKRAKIFLEQEQEKQTNLKKKLDIIEKIKAMITSPDEANKSYQEFKKLQQEWKEIKLVPAEKANELWRNYQLYVEQYYDLLKLNSEAREYDFKKNLEIKVRLCEAAEKLSEESDVISAFHQLQKLHQEYRETGPVAKELREEIWARFKAASTVINKRHQQHFEELRSKEEDNLASKTALCEKVEEIASKENISSGEWNKLSKEIEEIQQEWRGIGFASRKENQKIYDRFRAACDKFFGRKREFFSGYKDTMNANLEKKTALCEAAEALKSSTDWKRTSDQLINLQKQWKEIGAVPRRKSEQLWKRFRAACDEFFNERDKHVKPENDFYGNLKAKQRLIDEILAFEPSADESENIEAMNGFMQRWQGIGFVPFKEKDNIAKKYKDALQAKFPGISVSKARRSASRAPKSEKEVLVQKYMKKEQDIITYENNIGFFAMSKNSEPLIRQMQDRIAQAKKELQELEARIRELESAEEKE